MARKVKRRKVAGAFPLKQALEKYGWSQNKLAKASGVGFHTINAIANARQQPRWQMVLRLATTIGADLGDFQPGKGGAA
jgi:transcriptional regulator with XRE-family HTH domain